MLVSATVEVTEVGDQAAKNAELFDSEVGLREVDVPLPGIGGIDQGFQDVERRPPDPVAQEELLAARQVFEHRNEPDDEVVVGLEGGTRRSGMVSACLLSGEEPESSLMVSATQQANTGALSTEFQIGNLPERP